MPMDEASASIGKQMAQIFITMYIEFSNHPHNQNRGLDLWRNQGYEMMKILGGPTVKNAGVVSGFFHELSLSLHERLRVGIVSRCSSDDAGVEEGDDDFLHWWLKCISICEESGYTKVLQHCIKGYVAFAIQKIIFISEKSIEEEEKTLVIDGSNDSFYLANLYHKSKLHSTRRYLLRECIHAAFHPTNNTKAKSVTIPAQVTIAFLSPLLYLTVVSCSVSSTEQYGNASLCLSLIMQECRLCAMRDTGELTEWIEWWSKSLMAFFASPKKVFEINGEMMALGVDFITQLCEFCLFALLHVQQLDDPANNVMSHFFNVILGNVLPKIVGCGQEAYIAPSLQPILNLLLTVLSLVSNLQHENAVRVCILNSTIYNMGTMCLAMENEDDIDAVLKILCLIVKHAQISSHQMVQGVLRSLGYVFRSVQTCSATADDMLHRVDERQSKEERSQIGDAPKNDHFFDLFHAQGKIDALLRILIHGNKQEIQAEISSSNQCESLLLGLALVCISHFDSAKIPEITYAFLDKIIGNHNHLGRRCLPVLLATLEKYIESGSSSFIVPHLEFICSTVAQDSSCAHEIWSTLCSMASPQNPVPVQAMTIRLYPVLCKSNKRLYSRVHESLGRFMSHPNVTIRLSAAATICNLAKDDLIREVTDVIGSVQSLLLDEEVMVVHYAVLTLHYLILSEELDYSMVIKVLNKKLVDISDAQAILKLSDVVVNSVVQLMGNGEEEGDSSDDESDDSDHQEIVVSEQVQASTSGLRNIARAMSESLLNEKTTQYFDKETTLHLLSLVYDSLSKYSFDSIGIISTDFLQTEEYNDTKKIIELAYEISVKEGLDKNDYFNQNFIKLSRSLVLFEEDCLGPLLWKKLSGASKKSKESNLRGALESIPMAHDDTLTSFFANKIVEIPTSILSPSRQLALYSVKELSLPIEFVQVLDKLFDMDRHVESRPKPIECCVGILVSQLRIERRAAVERREYLKLYLSLVKMDSRSFYSSLWKHAPLILDSLGGVLPQLTTSDAVDCIPKLWSICDDKLSSEDGVHYAISFLKSMRYVLVQKVESKKISPALVKAIHGALTNTVLPTIFKYYHDPSIGRVQQAFYDCIVHISRDELLDSNVLTLGTTVGADICKIQLIAYLQHAGYFHINDPFLLRAAMWIGKQNPESTEYAYGKACFYLASSLATIPMSAQKEMIDTLFEAMLINGLTSLSLQVLLQCTTVWVKDSSLKYQALTCVVPSDSIETICQDMMQVHFRSQQIGDLSMIINLSTNLMKRSLSLLDTLLTSSTRQQKDLRTSDREFIFHCLASIFLSLKNQNIVELQHALASLSLSNYAAPKFN